MVVVIFAVAESLAAVHRTTIVEVHSVAVAPPLEENKGICEKDLYKNLSNSCHLFKLTCEFFSCILTSGTSGWLDTNESLCICTLNALD